MGSRVPDNLRHPLAGSVAPGEVRPVPGGRHVGIHDREFTLFQWSGLLASALEKGKITERLRSLLASDGQWENWPASTVSYAEMRSILEQLWHGEDRTQSIFNHAARINFTSFGSVVLAAMALSSGEEGVRFCARNFRTAWSPYAESAADGSMTMYHLPRFYDPEMRSALELFHFVNCFAVSRSRAHGIPVASRISFTGESGVSRSALEGYFGCPVVIGADVAHVAFTQEWLNRPVAMISTDIREKLLLQCEDALQSSEPQGRTALELLSSHVREIRSSDDMAKYLGISRRTLARLLDREGVSYSLLSKEVRALHAKMMLRKGVSIVEIAETLGFSDERSFRRAFRAWTGATPSEYRSWAYQQGLSH